MPDGGASDRPTPAPYAQAPIVLIDGAAPPDVLRATLTSLRAHTDVTLDVAVLDADSAQRLSSDAHDGSAGDGIVAEWAALLAPSRADVVVVQAGVVLLPGWLERLRSVAYGDSTCASASAVVAGRDAGSPSFRPKVPGPVWGAVYIRRDALNLASLAFDGDRCRASSVVAAIEAAVSAPGLVHRLANDVVVRTARPQAASEPAAAVRTSRLAPTIEVLVDARCLDRPLSGTQVQVLSLVERLQETDGVEVSCLVPRRLHESTSRLVGRLEPMQYTDDRLPQRRPDVFHRPYQFSSVGEVEACRGLGRRLVLTHQDMILDRTPTYHRSLDDWRSFREATAAAFATADQVAFFSRHAASDAASDGQLDETRVHVVPLGVDHPLGEPAGPDQLDERFPRLAGAPFLLVMGGAMRHKNRLFALRLFEQLVTRNRFGGSLVLAGDHPALGSSVEDERAYLDRRPELHDRVIDLQHVTDAERRALYERAELVLFPSLYEGFGLVPFEAAACGTACVYGWRSSLSEFLPPDGAVLEGWDVVECAARVHDLLEDDTARAGLVASIREVGQGLTWARTAAAYQDLYLRALSEPPRSAAEETPPLARLRVTTLTPAELELLDVYRRRPMLRAGLAHGVRLGTRVLQWARRARDSSAGRAVRGRSTP